MSENPFGRIADDGTVYAKLPDGGEKAVGQWAAGDPEAGLQYYRRRYLDLIVEADLALKRIKGGQATPEQAVSAAERLRAAVVDPSGIGDLAVLEQKAARWRSRRNCAGRSSPRRSRPPRRPPLPSAPRSRTRLSSGPAVTDGKLAVRPSVTCWTSGRSSPGSTASSSRNSGNGSAPPGPSSTGGARRSSPT